MYKHIQAIHKLEPLAEDKEKNHLCEVCGSSFTLKQNLNKHIRNFHIDSQPLTSEKDPSDDTKFSAVEHSDKHLEVKQEPKESDHDFLDDLESFESDYIFLLIF